MKRTGPLAPGIAFITGGARGLGNAIAVSFAKEGSKGICLAIHADVTKEEDVQRAVAEAVAEFGRIDYAANFAGVIGSSKCIWELTKEEFEQGMAVNSTGVLLNRSEPGRFIQTGSIINCASVNSLQSMAGTATYTASKHAVVGITKGAALEARKYGIRVNAVSPGFLLTDMVKGAVESEGKDVGTHLGTSIWKQFEARQGRSAVFEEIGDVVVLVSTPKMSLVNGHNIMVDGGFTINESNI
ncbi:hypothetical protein B7463_g3057, partial [Scytalidium lignicola]